MGKKILSWNIFFAELLYVSHCYHYNNNITMAQQPYMGSGLLLPPLFEVTKSCAFVGVGDWPTGRAAILSILMYPPEPSGRQSGDLGEKWRL
jgi:hypothetical protein